MTHDWLSSSLLGVLKAIGNGPPKDLIARVKPDADDHGVRVSAGDLTTLIKDASPADPLLTALGMQVHKWDAESDKVEWTGGTAPSTPARRDLICSNLGLNKSAAAELLAKRPIFVDTSVIVTAEWNHWYTPERANSHSFYWSHYMDYLLQVRKWPQDNVTALDLATTRVVERLADPTRMERHQAKGLVVGYVQSGKTANFTGVIAKAIDAGYRLVIVMTGTIEMLRAQTQRRIDMEMLGKQNILGDLTPDEAASEHVDYQDDGDWQAGRFLDFEQEARPTEIIRLTSHKHDYQKQFVNLKLERFQASKPLYDPVNLFSTAARLVVTKKNSTVLKKIVSDVKANKKAFAEIPVLIIDDESDQASVNTVNPQKSQKESSEAKERRAINARIAEMLALMPRAQYVGYTATPFANVFIDPSDPEDIYPKDFVLSLPRPDGYMGVEDFHDLEEIQPPTTAANSNYDAYVRDLIASDSPDDEHERMEELSRALDMFVLTGACKLYRATRKGGSEFRHHTMLIHESVRTADQKRLADDIRELWGDAGFTTPAGMKRLRSLYTDDVLRVSKARREKNVPALPEFDALKPYIAKAVGRITEHNNNPVLVVNSDKEVQQLQQQLDFDRNSTWRVLVGGAKLSRGFTVEGLTVTYFRRTAKMADSLTQMGRWFGFRHGYRDLVRLFIDRDARFNATKRVDLYKAFEAIALDEAAFRDQLAIYAEWDGDKPRVRPSQIPPLVWQHLPWLKPTAGNKMFNAKLKEQSDRVFSPAGYPHHLDAQRKNLDLWRPLLSACDEDIAFPAGDQNNLRAFAGLVDAQRLIDVIDDMQWMYDYKITSVDPKLAHYRQLLKKKPSPLKDFLVILPQPGEKNVKLSGVGTRRIVNRDRRARGGEFVQKFGEITDPKHRDLVLPLVNPHAPKGRPLAQWWKPTRGVALVYLVREQKPQLDPQASTKSPAGASAERGLILAFALYLPHSAVGQDTVLKFSVEVEDTTEATVDAV
ncbi:Z1 domain-containing protein [Mycobacterium europaeum]|uniref:Z1 domain-containing protein n=1 Tax=Mycobacterium europaeum TaxID=761804 RepID=UPI000A1648BD|nr:Z1 domain-containing protein [Mycobacterium europaeum]